MIVTRKQLSKTHGFATWSLWRRDRLFSGRTQAPLAEILRSSDESALDSVNLACHTLAHYGRPLLVEWITAIADNVVLRHAMKCGCAQLERWSKQWLKGEGRDAAALSKLWRAAERHNSGLVLVVEVAESAARMAREEEPGPAAASAMTAIVCAVRVASPVGHYRDHLDDLIARLDAQRDQRKKSRPSRKKVKAEA